ncbi:MAG TPA: CvpA family protein [Alphaproteobacteria bacterium]|nr:CvpA family protein [Alphaproteobacteria bacterium]
MIAVATAAHAITTDALPINWFDAALLVVLGFGIWRGRVNGMTKEIAPMFQWLAIVLAGGLCYDYLAQYFNSQLHFGKLWSALIGYLSITAVLLLIFTPIKKAFKKRGEKGGLFGSAEYYFGMFAGMVRYAAIVIFALALLNARSYTGAELAAKKAYNERWYGGGIYSGDYMPDLHTAQENVFKDSFSGPYIKSGLAMLLIQTGPGDSGAAGASSKPKQVIHIGK